MKEQLYLFNKITTLPNVSNLQIAVCTELLGFDKRVLFSKL